MEQIEKVSTKVKFKAFRKVNNSRRLEADKELEMLYSEKIKATSIEDIHGVEGNMAGKNLERQRKQYECKLEYLKTIKKEKGKKAAIFKLKEKVAGSKKEGMEAVTMKNPSNLYSS